jgi:hypothetical protein
LETIQPACGKPELKPIFDIVCGAPSSSSTESGRGLPGVELKAGGGGGPRLTLDQNHPGAKVEYEAKVNEVEGAVKVVRTVVGRLLARSLSYTPPLESASFASGSPFSGRATYVGKAPTHETSPGRGTWRGSLKVDFPGRAAVRLAGPSVKASIVHAKHRGFHELTAP